MALTWSSEVEAAVEARAVARALLVEFQTDGGSKYAWDRPFDLTESVVRGASTTWKGLGERLQLGGPIRLAVDLQGETASLILDASRINDDEDFVGALADASWHQRPIIVRDVLFAATAAFTAVVGVLHTWYGSMDRDEFSEGGEGSVWTLSLESGAYQFFRTNQHRRTNASQQRFFAGDRALEYTAAQVVKAVPFGTSAGVNIGGNSSGGSNSEIFIGPGDLTG